MQLTKISLVLCVFLFGTTSCNKRYASPARTDTQTSNPDYTRESAPTAPPQLIRKIEFINGPENTESEFPLSFTVRIVDGNGKLIEDQAPPIVVTIQNVPFGGSRLFSTGTDTLKPEKGQADFKTLAIETPGVGYTLSAVSGSIYGTSKAFNITPPQPRDVTLVFNGKSKIVRFEPPNLLIDKDGEKFPVYVRNLGTLVYRGKTFKIEIISPTEVHVTEFSN